MIPDARLNAHALDAPHAPLQALPRELWLGTTVAACGTRASRLRDLPRWMVALEQGELPVAQADWGDAQATDALRHVIAKLKLTTMTRGIAPAVQQVLRTMLWHVDSLIDRPAALSRSQAIAQMAQAFEDAWTVQRSDWDTVAALLLGAGDLSRLSCDALQGTLKRREWALALALQHQLAHAPDIVAMLAQLGRGVEPTRTPRKGQADAVLAPPVVVPVVERVTDLPDAPGHLQGIKLGRALSRMVPAEAAQFAHPMLHKLWRARMAEGRLQVWDESAQVVDRVHDPSGARHVPQSPSASARERGPMILCVDTSGSMQGAPERLAKAVVLEAAKVAHRERRACHLLAFGGPNEIIEHTLGWDDQGLSRVLDLLGQSFDGGTDVAHPLMRAIERVRQDQWRQADILIVSDGEFGVPREVHQHLDEACATLGLTVHGLLIGDRETMGLLEVCDHIHWVRDWRRFDPQAHTAQRFSPVHSKSLTALYFPNALSERIFTKHRHIEKPPPAA
jgi:uncharacterized protein with von Willebrand factor type A (vWA) domain